MQDQSAVMESSLNPFQEKTIPFALKEFGQVPRGSVSAWVAVSKKDLGRIAMEGIKITESKREKYSKLEKIFDEEAEKKGVPIRRKQCVYATPSPPEKSQFKFTGNGNVVLEIKIDPSSDNILVADADRYTLADNKLNSEFNNAEESARDEARQYWKEAVTLQEFIEEQKLVDNEVEGQAFDYETTFPPNAFDFNMPEILIPKDIPAAHIKVHSTI